MVGFLRRLTPDQQVTVLFLLVFGVLALATAALVIVSLRERAHDESGEARGFGSAADLAHARALLRSSWFMVLVF